MIAFDPYMSSYISLSRTFAWRLLEERMALSIKHKVIQTNNIRLREGQIEVLEDLSKVKATQSPKLATRT